MERRGADKRACFRTRSPHLVVNFELLDRSEFQEHPEGGGDHGVVVQGEVVEVELVDAELAAQRDLGGLARHFHSDRLIGDASGVKSVHFLHSSFYLESVNFHLGAGGVVGQHLRQNKNRQK